MSTFGRCHLPSCCLQGGVAHIVSFSCLQSGGEGLRERWGATFAWPPSHPSSVFEDEHDLALQSGKATVSWVPSGGRSTGERGAVQRLSLSLSLSLNFPLSLFPTPTPPPPPPSPSLFLLTAAHHVAGHATHDGRLGFGMVRVLYC